MEHGIEIDEALSPGRLRIVRNKNGRSVVMKPSGE